VRVSGVTAGELVVSDDDAPVGVVFAVAGETIDDVDDVDDVDDHIVVASVAIVASDVAVPLDAVGVDPDDRWRTATVTVSAAMVSAATAPATTRPTGIELIVGIRRSRREQRRRASAGLHHLSGW